jgi:hypothetical protein
MGLSGCHHLFRDRSLFLTPPPSHLKSRLTARRDLKVDYSNRPYFKYIHSFNLAIVDALTL